MKLGDLLREKMDEFSQEAGNYLPKNSGKFISDMELDDYVSSVLKVTSKRMQTTRDGKNFLLLTFEDRSGNMRGIDWWNADLNDERLTQGTVVRVEGKIKLFDTKKQLNIKNSKDAVTVLSKDEYDPKKFIEITSKDVKVIYDEVLKIIDSIKDKYVKALLEAVFVNDEKFVVRFLDAPAATSVHHAYKGGLIEHSLDVVKLAKDIRNNYPDMDINDDILIAGALLHDIGKTKEYILASSGIERSGSGEMLGHIIMGIEMVDRYADSLVDFPHELLMEINHIILSHHGEIEWGAPIQPKTIEAMIVHAADNADSKIAQFREITKKTLDDNNAYVQNQWSEYNRFLDRKIKVKGVDQSYE